LSQINQNCDAETSDVIDAVESDSFAIEEDLMLKQPVANIAPWERTGAHRSARAAIGRDACAGPEGGTRAEHSVQAEHAGTCDVRRTVHAEQQFQTER